MNNFFFSLENLIKPFYLVLVCTSLFFFTSLSAQKKATPKSNDSIPIKKRVIYGEASFYANKFNGRQTANGEIFSQSKLTCACNMLPLGTWVKVTNVRNGKSVIVKVNDRLHPKMRRVVDLSTTAAKKIGHNSGVTRVKVEVIGKKKPD
jgi:rare lipoprotein A